jgi:quercetin 2,3-dioxygenase
MNTKILQRDSLPLGGFEGIKEHRLVVDHKIGGDSDTWDGLGSFVYLADARYNPNGESKRHSHKEIDVISVIVEGRVDHEGSMKHGQSLNTNQAQAQRAGGEGFSHNEINPDNSKNRMIQLWVLPEIEGEPASYKFYNLEEGKLTRIYGGKKNQNKTLYSHTIMEVGIFSAKQDVSKSGSFLAYITKGEGKLNDKVVKDGDLIRGTNLNFTATNDAQIIIISIDNNEEK